MCTHIHCRETLLPAGYFWRCMCSMHSTSGHNMCVYTMYNIHSIHCMYDTFACWLFLVLTAASRRLVSDNRVHTLRINCLYFVSCHTNTSTSTNTSANTSTNTNMTCFLYLQSDNRVHTLLACTYIVCLLRLALQTQIQLQTKIHIQI